jgi:ArsR family transcriptional regulator
MFYRLAYPEVADLLAVSRTLLVRILETTQEQLVSTMNLPELGNRANKGSAKVSA